MWSVPVARTWVTRLHTVSSVILKRDALFVYIYIAYILYFCVRQCMRIYIYRLRGMLGPLHFLFHRYLVATASNQTRLGDMVPLPAFAFSHKCLENGTPTWGKLKSSRASFAGCYEEAESSKDYDRPDEVGTSGYTYKHGWKAVAWLQMLGVFNSITASIERFVLSVGLLKLFVWDHEWDTNFLAQGYGEFVSFHVSVRERQLGCP